MGMMGGFMSGMKYHKRVKCSISVYIVCTSYLDTIYWHMPQSHTKSIYQQVFMKLLCLATGYLSSKYIILQPQLRSLLPPKQASLAYQWSKSDH